MPEEMKRTILVGVALVRSSRQVAPVVFRPARGGPPPAPATCAGAGADRCHGYWVSVVTEDWRWRMVTPQKGDYTSLPLNPEGRHAADQWDLRKTMPAAISARHLALAASSGSGRGCVSPGRTTPR